MATDERRIRAFRAVRACFGKRIDAATRRKKIKKVMREFMDNPQNQRVLAELAKR